MPRQSLLKLVKRWRRYQPLVEWKTVPRSTRGLYVLYRQKPPEQFEVFYIGVAGLGDVSRGGIRSRLRNHVKKKPGWTHFSFFEVHDNVTSEEIRELEALLLGIFRHDRRIQLANKHSGSKRLAELRKAKHWK